MADTFTYIPAKGFSKTPKIRLKNLSFGDGYSQRTPDGINNVSYEWSMSFVNRPHAEANTIDSFFLEKGGWAHFLWTPPDELIEYKVTCAQWSSVVTSPAHKTVTATFVQVFDQ